jgi:hypothetical protein
MISFKLLSYVEITHFVEKHFVKSHKVDQKFQKPSLR